ncbi:MAG: galactose mutarotase [Rhizobiaceae bacterium]|nr:galactose mutarotase [Hyphomicrobiales bacterium]NRB29115.1 galactose mutarotase [Rhizobiaceae bacterium]
MTIVGANKEIFGQTEDGQSVYRVTLTGGGLTANILTWGAILQDLRLEGHQPPLVLGFDNFADYPAHSPYFGATVGRFANRIGGGSFEIDGQKFLTDTNNGENTLHGGSAGIGKRHWKIADLGSSHVYLTLDDPDGTMGFPGNCAMTCDFTLKDDGCLHIAYSVRSDAPTPAGLAHHSYFNLSGEADCRDHEVQIFAKHYLPVNDALIPNGDVVAVAGTPFDFQTAKPIGRDLGGDASGDLIYDHNFCLSNGRRGLQDVAIAKSAVSGVQMTVATTEPGLQFYAGHKVATPVPGLQGEAYGAYAGFCMETQNWPDAPNHDNFPNAIVRPGEDLRQVTEYRFTKA